MSYRILVAASVASVMASVSPAVVTVAGQAPKAAAASTYTPPASNYKPARTSWGDPDLTGVYDYQTVIRLTRPANLAGKATFTDAELAEWTKINAPNRDACGIGTRANETCPPDNGQGGVGAYNEFWNERNFVKNNNTSLVVDPPDGKYPPLTPEAEKRRREIVTKAREVASWEDYHALERCVSSQTPNGPQAYNSGTYIMQSPGWVLIVRERLDTRVIPLDQRPHVGSNIREWNGDSIGHWEGNTLVVETTNFTDKQKMGGASGASVPAGIPFGNFHVVERFVPVSAKRIEYYATVTDPTTYTSPWTLNIPWERDDDYRILEYACHEGNVAMGNSLRGERMLEEAAAKKGQQAK